MRNKTVFGVLFTVLIMACMLAVPVWADTPEPHYDTIVTFYQKAVADEDNALDVLEDLITYYEAHNASSGLGGYLDAQYYYDYAKGRVAFARQNYLEAWQYFGYIAPPVEFGQDTEYYYDFCMAMLYRQAGDWDQALTWLENARKLARMPADCIAARDAIAEELKAAAEQCCARGDHAAAQALYTIYSGRINPFEGQALISACFAHSTQSTVTLVSARPTGNAGIVLEVDSAGRQYCVEWAADETGTVKDGRMDTVEQKVILSGLLPGTVYIVRVFRDGSENPPDTAQVTTAAAQPYIPENGETIGCESVMLKTYDHSHYLRQRQMSAGYSFYSEIRKNSAVAAEISLAADHACMAGFTMACSEDTLRALEGKAYTLILRLDGYGAAAYTGTVGDAYCCVSGKTILLSLENAAVQLRTRYTIAGRCRASAELLIEGLQLCRYDGAAAP